MTTNDTWAKITKWFFQYNLMITFNQTSIESSSEIYGGNKMCKHGFNENKLFMSLSDAPPSMESSSKLHRENKMCKHDFNENKLFVSLLTDVP